jgi:Catalase
MLIGPWISRKTTFVTIAGALQLAGCSHLPTGTSTVWQNHAQPVSTDFASGYPEPDLKLGETLQADEIESAERIAAVIATTIRRSYAEGEARRDAHPKAHGCVRATFEVTPDLDPRLTKGVFQPGKRYPAWIRFSNGNEDPNRADDKGDGRGMAIKLMGVSGDFLSKEGAANETQDFIMISHPVFLLDDASAYVSLVEAVNSEGLLASLLRPIRVPLALGVAGTWNAYQTTSKKIDNPLQTRYWSMTAYRLGTDEDRQAVKFSARPCTPHEHVLPDDPDPNFLRAAMRDSLAAGPACMEFLLQPRTSPAMSVEDTQTEWEEADAPFYKAATITIPKQTFDTPEQNRFCEDLSFNPWRALEAHRPLGAVNRMRKPIYETISNLRRTMNDAPVAEPKPDG